MNRRPVILSLVGACVILLLIVICLGFMKLRPKIQTEYHLFKATKAHDKGHYDTAIVKYKKVLETNPKDEAVNFNLGVAYIHDNQMSKAREQVRKLREWGMNDHAKLLQELINRAAAGELPK